MTASSRPRPLQGPAYRMAAWGVLGLQAATLIETLRQSDGMGTTSVLLLMATTGGLLAASHRRPDLLPDAMAAVFSLAALGYVVGWTQELFQTVTHYDDVMHFYTGFAAAVAVTWPARRLGLPGFAAGGRRTVLAAAATALAIGLGWEGMEAVFAPLPLGDTLGDLLLDTLGGALAGSLLVLRSDARPAPRPAE